jgi:diaminopimelate decarboxylase
MDVFNRRISLDEAGSIVQLAARRQLLDGANSAIFHHFGLMRSRVAVLQAAFPNGTLHTVAIKANPVLEILRELVQAGTGLEAASLEEVELARAAGCESQRIVFDSPAKTVHEIEQTLRWGVVINADNFDELGRIAAARRTTDSTSQVGLRANAMVGGGTIAHTSVSQSNSKFGVPLATDRRKIVNAFADYPWLCGLHVHVGSQGCSLSLLVEAVERIAGLRREIMVETGRVVSYVDVGGGLSTVYCTGESCQLRIGRKPCGIRQAGTAAGGGPPGGRFPSTARISAGRLETRVLRARCERLAEIGSCQPRDHRRPIVLFRRPYCARRSVAAG